MARKKIEPIETLGKDTDNLEVQKSRPLFALWRSNLSLAEFKILDTYLSRIDSHKPERRTVIFEKGEIEEALGVTQIKTKDLKQRLTHLMGNVVEVKDESVKKGFKLITLFEEAEAEQDDDSGLWTIKLECTQKAMKYFFNIENLGYLRYKLRCITSITSRYTYIMFMYLESNRYRKSWQVDLEELKHILNCDEEETYKQYKRFNDLILKKVYKELTEKTECKYEYKPIKKGRKVVAIEFTLYSKALIQEFNPIEPKILDDEIETIKSVTNNEFNDKQMNLIKTLIFHYSNDYKTRIDYLNVKYQEMILYEPKNKFNYLKKIIENDIAKNQAEDVLDGQTTIEDYLEETNEDTPVAEFDPKELDELLGELREGRL